MHVTYLIPLGAVAMEHRPQAAGGQRPAVGGLEGVQGQPPAHLAAQHGAGLWVKYVMHTEYSSKETYRVCRSTLREEGDAGGGNGGMTWCSTSNTAAHIRWSGEVYAVWWRSGERGVL